MEDSKDGEETRIEEPSAALDALAHRTIGAAIEVHRHLGPGFLEFAYEEALCLELTARGIPYARQVPIIVRYKAQPVGEGRLDLLVDDCLILELKACECIAPIHISQTLSYLRATGLRLALLINFNVTLLHRGIKRIIGPP